MRTVDEIRTLLHQDPYWCVYALGDLDPRRRGHCEWHVRGRSVALVYREFDLPILFASGEPDVLDAVPALPDCLLQLPEAFRPAVERRFPGAQIKPMVRMSLAPGRLQAPDTGSAEPLTGADEQAIRELYADGEADGEEPDFFMASQLADGAFFGVRREGRLVAAGGTHLYSAEESVGAIGNVYTHRAHRGRGYGAAVTGAIARRLLERGTQTIALNVKAGNEAAIRLYDRLGFTVHTRFFDGRATRR